MTPRTDTPLRPDTFSGRDEQALPAFLSGGNEHPLIDIPYVAFVDGRQYSGEGISLVEAHVVGLADPALENQERLVRIAFDFGGFSVSLHPKARILRDSPQRLVLRFTEPTGDHLPQLRHILNEYISGDMTSFGTVIRAGAQAAPKAGGSRATGTSPLGTIRRILGTVAVLALTLLLFAVAATFMAERLLVTRIAAPGQVVIAGETLRAVADGQITYLDPTAPQGEVAFAIATTSGETLSIAMPCDCEALPAGIVEGSTVLAGEPVLTLVEGEQTTAVEASIPMEDLFPLQQAGGAELRLADGRMVFGQLDNARAAAGVAAGDDYVPVRLLPEEPIDATLAGQAVELRIRRDAGSLTERLAEGRTFLSSLWTDLTQP
jgi:hypothetical protein